MNSTVYLTLNYQTPGEVGPVAGEWQIANAMGLFTITCLPLLRRGKKNKNKELYLTEVMHTAPGEGQPLNQRLKEQGASCKRIHVIRGMSRHLGRQQERVNPAV